MDLAMVPAAPPTRKNQRATSWPAPISANVPYFDGSRWMKRLFWCVTCNTLVMTGQNTPQFKCQRGEKFQWHPFRIMSPEPYQRNGSMVRTYTRREYAGNHPKFTRSR